VNRRTGAKKQAPARRPKKPAAPKTPASSRTKPVRLTEASSDYVGKVAAAMMAVSAAQDKWVQEIETVSANPALLQDPACQAKLTSAMRSVVLASAGLRVEPVPDGMQPAADLLDRARTQAELADPGGNGDSSALSTEAIVASIQHLDEMAQLLQQAYKVIRG
jgi:hypothetical protein